MQASKLVHWSVTMTTATYLHTFVFDFDVFGCDEVKQSPVIIPVYRTEHVTNMQGR